MRSYSALLTIFTYRFIENVFQVKCRHLVDQLLATEALTIIHYKTLTRYWRNNDIFSTKIDRGAEHPQIMEKSDHNNNELFVFLVQIRRKFTMTREFCDAWLRELTILD